MSAQWLSSSSDVPGRVSAAVEGGLRAMAQPARARLLRQGCLALFALWAILALARLIWALFPSPEPPAPVDARVLNPVSLPVSTGTAAPVDIQRMVSWHLFGEADAVQPEEKKAPAEAAVTSSRAGIEQGARETRLDLKLRGVVASAEDGLGYAIIENKKRQNMYSVDDKLPVSGQVLLAKVMPRQVVLDNGGKYELLTLYEEGALDAQLPAGSRQAPGAVPRKLDSPASAATGPADDAGASAVAQNYRERLYQDPQSLAEVVNVSAVRKDGALLGYRIGPGKDRQQFEQLGFKPGDLVTSVNGIALDDPANTMRLYQTMRTANEAVFDLERDGRRLSVSVSLGNGEAQ